MLIIRTIIVFLLTLFSVGISNAQHQWKHKPFKDFGQDTLSYLKQNFDSKFNGNYFKGKSVAELINRLDIKFEYIAIGQRNGITKSVLIEYKSKPVPKKKSYYSSPILVIRIYPTKCPQQYYNAFNYPLNKDVQNFLKTLIVEEVNCYENEVLLIKKE